MITHCIYGILLFAVVYICKAQELRYLGSMPMEVPAFAALYDHGEEVEDATQRYSIIFSTFAVQGETEDVNFLWYPGSCLADPTQCSFDIIGSEFEWPRKPGQIPESTFNSNKFIYVADGFVAPGTRDGAIHVCDVRDESNVIVTDITSRADDPTQWFYGDSLWKDGDGDDVLDVFTCRTRVQNFPPGVFSEFLWFKHPGGNDPGSEPWEIGTIISENDCDTFYVETTLTAGGETFDVMYTTGYFMNKLSVYWTSGTWDNSSVIESRVIGTLIDDADCVPGEGLCGHFFDIKVEDINADGNLDLLVTINSELYGHLVAYEIPADFRTGEYLPIILAEGFIPRIGADNQGAPGLMQTFYPSTSVTGKPWILLTGDDEGTFYYLTPENQQPNNWNYELINVYDGGANFTMGGPIAVDSNGDGFTEFFVGSYTGNEILFYTFAP